jgi:hypothetical protein
VGLVEGIVVGEVRQRHGAHGLAPVDHPAAVLVPHLVALAHGPVDDELGRLLDRRPGRPHGPGQAPPERGDALPRHGRDAQVERHPGSGVAVTTASGAPLGRGAVGGQVGPAAHDHALALEQVRLVGAQLVEQDRQLLGGRPLGQRRQVEQHAQHPGPLDVSQELVPQAPALAGALDEPGDVCHHVLVPVVEPHDPKVGDERGEGVVGHLGLGGRDAADQRGLAHVREPHQRHVGEQLQLEPQPVLLAVLALLGEGGRAPAVGQEAGVAPPAPPALGGQVAVTHVHQVGQQLAVAVAHHGAHGHGHDDVAARPAVAGLAHAVRAVARPAERVVPEREQRGDVVVGDQPDVAPRAAVTPVGAAPGDVRLPAERHRPGAAVPGLGVEVALVDKLDHCLGV